MSEAIFIFVQTARIPSPAWQFPFKYEVCIIVGTRALCGWVVWNWKRQTIYLAGYPSRGGRPLFFTRPSFTSIFPILLSFYTNFRSVTVLLKLYCFTMQSTILWRLLKVVLTARRWFLYEFDQSSCRRYSELHWMQYRYLLGIHVKIQSTLYCC